MDRKAYTKIKLLIILIGIILAVSSAAYLLRPSLLGFQHDKNKSLTASANITAKKIKFAYRANDYDSYMEQSIKNYLKKYGSGVEIELLKIPQEKYDDNLNMLFTSGERPDVFDLGYEWIGGYVTKEWIKNLKEYCDKAFMDRFPFWINNYTAGIYNSGELYSLPACQTTIRLIYNRELFKEAGLDPDSPPTTIDELKDYAERISYSQKGFKKYGFALNEGDGRKCFEQFMEGANTFSGINYYDYKNVNYSITSYSKWLSAIRDMKANGSLLPGSEILSYENELMLFAKGNIGMMYASSSAVRIIEDLTEQQGYDVEWDVGLPPFLDKGRLGKGKVSVIPTTFYCINNTTGNEEAAVGLWKYLYTDEHAGLMFREDGSIPVFEDILVNSRYVPKIRNIEGFLPKGFDAVYPVGPKTVDDWSRFEAYQAALVSDKPVEQILTKENENINYQYKNPSVVQKFIDPNADPDFDWLNPIK